MGQMSRAMLERYSHIRMAAEISGITLRQKGKNSQGAPAKVPVPATSMPYPMISKCLISLVSAVGIEPTT